MFLGFVTGVHSFSLPIVKQNFLHFRQYLIKWTKGLFRRILEIKGLYMKRERENDFISGVSGSMLSTLLVTQLSPFVHRDVLLQCLNSQCRAGGLRTADLFPKYFLTY